jgi:hypothetical protein
MCETKKKYKTQDLSGGEILCYSCNQKKTLDNFYKHKGGTYRYKCKECISSSRERKYEKREVKDGKIKCDKCSLLKELSDFDIVGKKYPSRKCKKCQTTIEERMKKKPIQHNDYRTCKICKETLPIDRFNSKMKVRFRECTCKKCLYEKNKDKKKEYVIINKEMINKRHKKWRENTEKGKEYVKRSKRKENSKIKEEKRILREEKKLLNLKKRERVKEEKRKKWEEQLEIWRLERERKEKIKQDEIRRKKEYYESPEYFKLKKEKEYLRWKRRWENDDLFAMKVRIRNLVRNTFRKSGHTKPNKRTIQIIGCDYEKLKSHLESKFKDGMSWDNRGEWHIDHIVPLSSAKTKEELIKLSHYENLQPLWWNENLSKGNKIL